MLDGHVTRGVGVDAWWVARLEMCELDDDHQLGGG